MKQHLLFLAFTFVGLTNPLFAQAQHLTSIAEVAELKQAIGLEKEPPPEQWPTVDFTAVVTYSDPVWNFAFVQEGKHAIFVTGNATNTLEAQTRVRIVGEMLPGDLLPIVRASSIHELGQAELPPAKSISLDKAEFGQFDSLLVQVEAEVIQTLVEPRCALLYCKCGETYFYISIAEWDIGPRGLDLVGSKIRCTGALGVQVLSHAFAKPGDFPNKIDCFRVMCSGLHAIEWIDPKVPSSVNDRFECETVRVKGLAELELNAKRFVTHGQVAHIDTVNGQPQICVLDEFASVLVRLKSVKNIHQGMILTLSGTTYRGSNSFEVDYVQLLGHHALPVSPGRSVSELATNGKVDSRQTVAATPIQIKAFEDYSLLRVSDGQKSADVLLKGEALRMVERVSPAAAQSVSISGLFGPTTIAGSRSSFQIVCTDPSDIEILEQTGFPTQLVAILSSVLGGIVLWSWLLRRQVAEKTHDLSQLTAQLLSSYEAIEDGILVVDGNGMILAVNQEFCRLANCNLEMKMSVARLPERIEAEFSKPEAFLRYWNEFESDYETTASFSAEGLNPAYAAITVSTSPIKNPESDEPIGRLWVFRNETEKRQLSTELARANKLEAVGRLAGGVAHDFNNILAAITSNLSVAQLDPSASVESVYSELSMAKDAAYRGADVSRRLLTFSTELSLNLEPHSINQLIEKLSKLIRHSFDASIEFTLELDPQDPVVNIESAAIEQVLMNLYVNARDAMPEGGLIRTRTQVIQENATELVRISVQDSGGGIPTDVREHIFDPFFSTKGPQEGTGLGLSTSYRVVDQHGGVLKLASVPEGSPTEFWIDLPVCEKKPVHSPRREAKTSRSCRVLIVDDEKAVRFAASRILESQGFLTLQASDGDEALKLLEENASDVQLVLLDLTMPGMSGTEVLKQIKKRWPMLPVVVCSGYIVNDSLSSGDSRPDAVIAKPYSVAELMATFDEIMPEPMLG